MAKKVNPHRVPVTQADVDKAWHSGIMKGIRDADVIYITATLDVYPDLDILKIWDRIAYITDSVKRGYCTIADMRCSLREEYKIDL